MVMHEYQLRKQREADEQDAKIELATQSNYAMIQVSQRRWRVIERDGFFGTSRHGGELVWIARFKSHSEPLDYEGARVMLIELRTKEDEVRG
jgi:hypothetical protein